MPHALVRQPHRHGGDSQFTPAPVRPASTFNASFGEMESDTFDRNSAGMLQEDGAGNPEHLSKREGTQQTTSIIDWGAVSYGAWQPSLALAAPTSPSGGVPTLS